MAVSEAERPRPVGAPDAMTRQSADEAPLTVAAVAARLGVAASTLRTWDRRYGLGASAHKAGRHRRYTPADIARLETMRRLTLRGVPPADAARIAAEREDGAESATAAIEDDESDATVADPLTLAAAAVEPSGERPERLLIRAAQREGLVAVWTDLVGPARELLAGPDDAVVRRPGAEPLLVLDSALLAAVRAVSAAVSTPRVGGVLVIADPERRVLGHVVAGALAQRGVRARVSVTPALEPGLIDTLIGPGGDSGPKVLAIAGRPKGVTAMARELIARDGAGVYLLGPGDIDLWQPGVHRLRTLAAAVGEIAHVAGG